MCIYIYIYTYVYIYIYINMNLYTCIYTYIHIHLHIHIHIHIHIHVERTSSDQVHRYIYKWICTISIYIHKYIYIHTHIYTYMRINIYVHIYTHIHTYEHQKYIIRSKSLLLSFRSLTHANSHPLRLPLLSTWTVCTFLHTNTHQLRGTQAHRNIQRNTDT